LTNLGVGTMTATETALVLLIPAKLGAGTDKPEGDESR